MGARTAKLAATVLVSALIFPASAPAVESSRTLQVGHLGDRIEATVEITSEEGRMSAVPRIRIKEDPAKIAKSSADDSSADSIKKASAAMEDGEISLSRGLKLLDQAKEAVKKRKAKKTGAGEQGADAGTTGEPVSFCENCNYKIKTASAIQ